MTQLKTNSINAVDHKDGTYDIICPLCNVTISKDISEKTLFWNGLHIIEAHYKKEHPGVTPLQVNQ